MFIAELHTPLGTEPFEWQKLRMESIRDSVSRLPAAEKRERKKPRRNRTYERRSPALRPQAAGRALG